MINLIETLFGAALGFGIAAAITYARDKKPIAMRLASVAVFLGVLAGLLELYVRMRP
jgi:hypothetical protein